MSKPRVSLAHQINPSFARHAALALKENGLLHEAITTFAYNPKSAIAKLLNILPQNMGTPIANELSRRIWPEVNLKIYPWQEIIRIFLARTRLAPRLAMTNKQLVDWVYLGLDEHIAKHHLQDIDAIYSYEDLATTTFKKAKEKGVLCLYDLPIPYYQMKDRIMKEEAEKFPQLSANIEIDAYQEWKIKRKQEEVQLADHIFVASSVTQRSLLEIGVEKNKITVIPYGTPVDQFQPQPKKDDVFRVLYVGRISTRKGVQYLMPAWEQLKLDNAELLLVGSNLFPQGWLEQYNHVSRHIPSVPHLLLDQYYSQGSVLVFPSIMEGFGLVILEAMACGIPVITTPNTGGFDVITDGVEGFIVPIRDVEALKEKIQWCYDHPQELAEMGKMARKKAEELNWSVYRQKLAFRVREILDNRVKSLD